MTDTPAESNGLSYEMFRHWVQEALNHLYDAAFLKTSPLIERLVPAHERSPHPAKGLRRVLIAAIHAKEPPRGAPPQSHDWRGYQILEQRYITGLAPDQVAARLNISRSLFFLEQARVLESLVTDLWEQRQESDIGDLQPELAVLQPAEAEMERLLETIVLGPVHIGKLVTSVEPIVRLLAEASDVTLSVSLPGSCVIPQGEWVLLRQVVISCASELIASIPGGRLVLRTFEEQSSVGLQLVAESDERSIEAGAPQPHHGLSLSVRARLLTVMRGDLELVQTGETRREILLRWETQGPVRSLLLVDDNEDIADLFRRYLAGTRWEVTAVADVSQARRVLPGPPFAVVVLDVLMPQEDGWEFLVALKADPVTRTIPVIICSAINEAELASSLGAVAYLSKPVSERDLLKALSVWS